MTIRTGMGTDTIRVGIGGVGTRPGAGAGAGGAGEGMGAGIIKTKAGIGTKHLKAAIGVEPIIIKADLRAEATGIIRNGPSLDVLRKEWEKVRTPLCLQIGCPPYLAWLITDQARD